MKKPLKNLDYITKDYEGFRQLMIDSIPKLTPEWTDTSSTDMGIVLIELLSYGLDILSLYQDKYFNEAFLATAKTRKGVIAGCKTFGYKLTLQTPFIQPITFTKSDEYLNDDVTIPALTKVSTSSEEGEPVVFETDKELIIPKGVKEGVVLATHGVTVANDDLGIGLGEPEQTCSLTYPDVLIDTLQIITMENGIPRTWEAVDDFLNSKPESRHYVINVDSENNFSVTFGSGNVGMMIPKGAPIIATYRVGGGSIGDVGLNTIVETVDVEIAGIQSISNKTEAYRRGADVEDIEHARLNAPRQYRSVDRCVTVTDFEDVASRVPGVAKVKCVETFNAQKEVYIYIVPDDYKQPSEGLKEEVLSLLNSKKLVVDTPVIQDTKYKDFSIKAKVFTYSNYINEDVQLRVTSALEDAFDPFYMDFGEEVTIASIVKVAMMQEGVRNIVIETPESDLKVEKDEIARLISTSVTVEGGSNYAE